MVQRRYMYHRRTTAVCRSTIIEHVALSRHHERNATIAVVRLRAHQNHLTACAATEEGGFGARAAGAQPGALP